MPLVRLFCCRWESLQNGELDTSFGAVKYVFNRHKASDVSETELRFENVGWCNGPKAVVLRCSGNVAQMYSNHDETFGI